MENHDPWSLSYGYRREVYVGLHSLRLVISLRHAYYASQDKGKQNKQEFLLNNNNCFQNKLIKWCEVMLNYEKQPGWVPMIVCANPYQDDRKKGKFETHVPYKSWGVIYFHHRNK